MALRLAELVSARLCHDLSGLMGTLTGTLELAAELTNDDPASAEQALGLASEAALSLGRRLRLLRAAWAEPGEALSAASLERLTDGLADGGRIRLDLSGIDPALAFAPAAARLLLNTILLAVEALPAGRGVIALSGAPGQDVTVSVDGPRAAWPGGLASSLTAPQQLWTLLGGGGDAALSPTRNLQIALTVMIARAGGFGLSFATAGAPDAPPPLLVSFAQA